MTERMRTALIVIAVAMIAGAMAVVVSLPAMGTQQPDDYQDDYIEECEVYRNHSGYISSYYDYAVFFEQGFEPIHVETNGQPIFLEPPDGVAWDRVYKCEREEETTTTTMQEETTTTVSEETTTTASEETTTTVGDTTSTTVVDSTTTTDPGDSTLPFTGMDGSSGLWAAGALGLLAIGGLIVRSVRADG